MKKTSPKSALESKQIIAFNAMLRELYPQNKAEVKEGILSGYNVASTKDLTSAQLGEIILALQKEKDKRQAEPSRAIRQARSKCIKLMDEIGIKPDWPSRNAFCEKPRLLNGRRLYDLTEEELEAFRKKLFAIKAEYARREAEEKTWATLN